MHLGSLLSYTHLFTTTLQRKTTKGYVTSCIKPEVHSVSQRHQRKTEPRPQGNVKFGVRQGSVLSSLYLQFWTTSKITNELNPSSYVILHADDILLISSSVCELQRIFHVCERELVWLDMVIKYQYEKKSCCMRISTRNDYVFANITTSKGYNLPWTNEIRYLGTYIVKSRQFRCSMDHAKKCFSRLANAIFGKVGRAASEEIALELLEVN